MARKTKKTTMANALGMDALGAILATSPGAVRARLDAGPLSPKLARVIVSAVQVLNSERATTLMVLHDQTKWLQSSTKRFLDDIADADALSHAHADELIGHAVRMNRLVEQLKEQNSEMKTLRSFADEFGVAWPDDITIIAVFDRTLGWRS